MLTNLYHHLAFMPAIEAWEMPPGLEALAQQLVKSGKLRINADHERNFVRYGEMTFSARELTDAALLPATRARLSRHIAPAEAERGMESLWAQLHTELKKARGVSTEKEMRVARVMTQAANPAVIQLLIASGTEIFVSYSHTVADLMPVHEWQGHGTAGGLQATDAAGTAVYVSAGGDPFFEGEHKTYVTDGFPALARMVIIAGQELGHFADLRRNANGNIIGRYSTDINASALRADPTARLAREGDMHRVTELSRIYQHAGLAWLRRAEKGVAFYSKRWRYSPPWWFYQLWRLMAWGMFVRRCREQIPPPFGGRLGGGPTYPAPSPLDSSYLTPPPNLPPKGGGIPTRFRTYPTMRLGEAIEAYLADMAFNLAPDADAYRHPDPLIEEAIAVIEAVARVPQQVHKWGQDAVATAWPGLYQFYYGTVIEAANRLIPEPEVINTISMLKSIIICARRLIRPKPGYYP